MRWPVLLCCVLVACESKDVTSSPSAQSFTAQRIVTLTPGLTEFIYAVGAEQALVGTVEYADYPAAAKHIPRVGDAFQVDMERLLALKPDLVLAWTSGTPVTTVERIKAMGLHIETLEVRHLSEVSATLLRMGQLTGHEQAAQQAATAFDHAVTELRREYKGSAPLRVFIEVNRQPLYTVNGQHVISEIVALCGGINVFTALNQLAPVIGIEAVLQADPDVILSTEANAEQVQQAWRAWPQLEAVKHQHIYAVSPDTTTRATPRLVQGAQAICQALQQARL